MKPIVYFFGILPKGFSSYPQDHTKEFFKGYISKSQSMDNESQIVLHREDNLLYYGHVRKMNKKQYFGVCVCMDCIYNSAKYLFDVFDDIFVSLLDKGHIIEIGPHKTIQWAVEYFSDETVLINEYSDLIRNKLDLSEWNTQVLPPLDFSIALDDCIDLSLENGDVKILEATKRYTNVYIAKKESEIARVNSMFQTIESKDKQIHTLKTKLQEQKENNNQLKTKLRRANAKKKSYTWVLLLTAYGLVASYFLCVKVLFPSEVSHYNAKDFIYYGSLKNTEPQGWGVAKFHSPDKQARKCYIGNFIDGIEQDTAALLQFTNGDCYYGSISGNQMLNGMLFQSTTQSCFKGRFVNNKPFDGVWYSLKQKYKIEDGEQKVKRSNDYSNSSSYTYLAGNPQVNQHIKVDGEEGMEILFKLGINNKEGISHSVCIYFYDNNGNKLKDQNDKYCTTNGEVSVGKDVTPASYSAKWSAFTLSIPYSELHLLHTKSTTIKYKIIIWDLSGSKPVAQLTTQYYTLVLE
ncbi:MAG: hypothetical protein ACI30R_00240 [Sodaliphilus sp.]